VNLSESGQPAKCGEACHRRGSNGHMHTLGSPGCKGTAREQRRIEEPGRPGVAGESMFLQRGGGKHNLACGRGRESDGLIVAKKRLTTVERRGLSMGMPT